MQGTAVIAIVLNTARWMLALLLLASFGLGAATPHAAHLHEPVPAPPAAETTSHAEHSHHHPAAQTVPDGRETNCCTAISCMTAILPEALQVKAGAELSGPIISHASVAVSTIPDLPHRPPILS